MNIRLIQPQERTAWNEYIERAPQAIAWQVYEWSEVVARHYDYTFLPMAAFEGDQIVGLLPLYRGLGDLRPMLISVPFAVAGGIVADTAEASSRLLDKAIELSREHGGAPVTLKQYKIRIAGDLKTDNSYSNRELVLTRDVASLEKEIEPINLTRAREAEKAGLEVEFPTADVDTFYDILLRHTRSEGVPCAAIAWIQTLIGFKMYYIAIARLRGRPLAATMIKKFKSTVSFPFSCVDPRVPDADIAVYGLYWHLIRRFAAEGLTIFHSGRISKNLETYDFRLGWGGTPYDYFYQYYPNVGGATEYKRRRGWKRQLVSAAWRWLPLSAARKLGPRIVRRFP